LKAYELACGIRGVSPYLSHARNGFGPAEDSARSAGSGRFPQPAGGEILVEVAACGVCRTDLHVVDGELPQPKLPIVPGNEIVGPTGI
jgi:threonine dehydrogenase-like Zn-dependent dehydrogenase